METAFLIIFLTNRIPSRPLIPKNGARFELEEEFSLSLCSNGNVTRKLYNIPFKNVHGYAIG
jgi:hypothetical protein